MEISNLQIEDQFYLSESEENLMRLVKMSDYSITCAEIEEIVGRFKKHSIRARQLRG